jgi:hypothetical protein
MYVPIKTNETGPSRTMMLYNHLRSDVTKKFIELDVANSVHGSGDMRGITFSSNVSS